MKLIYPAKQTYPAPTPLIDRPTAGAITVVLLLFLAIGGLVWGGFSAEEAERRAEKFGSVTAKAAFPRRVRPSSPSAPTPLPAPGSSLGPAE